MVGFAAAQAFYQPAYMAPTVLGIPAGKGEVVRLGRGASFVLLGRCISWMVFSCCLSPSCSSPEEGEG